MRDRLVRGGDDVQLVNVVPLKLADGSYVSQFNHDAGYAQHVAHTVYREMILQICADYPGLPDVRTLDIDAIAFFYDGLRKVLRSHTKK